MSELTSICVYCGSRSGRNPSYQQAATLLGGEIAANHLRLVYGGGSVGLMGTVARACLDAGGEVTGVIPRFLQEREVMLQRVEDLVITDDMHQRKRRMFEEADAFVALPGGIGTLEEVVEMITWAQLGRHKKPVLLADIGGFWGPLTELLDHMISEEFITRETMIRYLIASDVTEIVPKLRNEMASLSAEALQGDEAALERL
ncbi:MAG: TIGR00730 family Rossman fold protein [Devosiaceae bacterium]|nr:TIGR00730 family Rossman fold protein [Devosiaceae bacterium MH13]